jgi:hypothetical protein
LEFFEKYASDIPDNETANRETANGNRVFVYLLLYKMCGIRGGVAIYAGGTHLGANR